MSTGECREKAEMTRDDAIGLLCAKRELLTTRSHKEPTEEAPIEAHEAVSLKGISLRAGQRVGTAVTVFVVVAASLIAFPRSSSGQEKEKPVPVLPSTGPQMENATEKKELPVRYENGIKIVGNKTFNVEIRDDSLYIRNFGGLDFAVDIKRARNMGILETSSTKEIRQLHYQSVGKRGSGVYIIFEYGITFVVPDVQRERLKGVHTRSPDGSKIFLHDGAIYVAPDGSIIATTPTTLLMITPNEAISYTYREIFGVDLNLKRPYMKRGKDDNHAELTDETLKENGKQIKFVIETNPFEIEGMEDTSTEQRAARDPFPRRPNESDTSSLMIPVLLEPPSLPDTTHR